MAIVTGVLIGTLEILIVPGAKSFSASATSTARNAARNDRLDVEPNSTYTASSHKPDVSTETLSVFPGISNDDLLYK
jgi:hypothetical protein